MHFETYTTSNLTIYLYNNSKSIYCPKQITCRNTQNPHKKRSYKTDVLKSYITAKCLLFRNIK